MTLTKGAARGGMVAVGCLGVAVAVTLVHMAVALAALLLLLLVTLAVGLPTAPRRFAATRPA